MTLQEPGSRLNSLKPSTAPSRGASSGEEAGTTRRASAGQPCGDGWTRTAEALTSDSGWPSSRRSRTPHKMGRLSGSGRRRPGSPLTGRHSRSAWHETAANADASVRNNPKKLSPMTFSLNQTHYQPCGTMEKT